MTLDLFRVDVDASRTIGRLTHDGRLLCFTLEDPIREGPKIAHETAIPAGSYDVVITRSRRFGSLLPLLLDVPDFEGIRIHAGNTTSDTSGCILVGLARTEDALRQSRPALEMVQGLIARALAAGERVQLQIRNPGEPKEVRV